MNAYLMPLTTLDVCLNNLAVLAVCENPKTKDYVEADKKLEQENLKAIVLVVVALSSAALSILAGVFVSIGVAIGGFIFSLSIAMPVKIQLDDEREAGLLLIEKDTEIKSIVEATTTMINSKLFKEYVDKLDLAHKIPLFTNLQMIFRSLPGKRCSNYNGLRTNSANLLLTHNYTTAQEIRNYGLIPIST